MEVEQLRFSKQDGELSRRTVNDVRDYMIPHFGVGEIFIGEDRSVTSTVETVVGVGVNNFLLKPRGADLSCRVFARGGMGFSPPPCLM
jgi:hypothetical protein